MNQLITDAYRELNCLKHERDEFWGTGARHYVDIVLDLVNRLGTQDVLDYGCGKGFLGALLPFPIQEYDPAVVGKDSSPDPADLVVCASVLEHVEPELIHGVLSDLRRCTKKLLFAIIPHSLASDILPDGRNAHINCHPWPWWAEQFDRHSFTLLYAMELQSMTSTKPGEVMLGNRTNCFLLPD
jgi:2-polyprenyl-3-methyl-5-hydroxy-6-metoxy-1,4-benzoquinol methylase